jgi:hypothetical protein
VRRRRRLRGWRGLFNLASVLTGVTRAKESQVELETGWVDMSEASQRLLRASPGLVVKYVERSQNYVACTATLEQKNEDSGMVRRIRMKPAE